MIQWNKTTAYSVFQHIKEWKKTGMIVLMDILFFGILFGAAKIFDTLFTSNEELFTGTIAGYGFLLGYFLIITTAYAFFKYAILQLMNSTQLEIKVTKAFLPFLLYTIISATILLTVFIAGTTFFAVSLITVLKQTALILFIVLYGIAVYFFISVSHFLLITEKVKLQDIPERVSGLFSWKFIVQWIAWNLVFFCIYAIIYLVLFMIVQVTTDNLLLFVLMNIIVFLFIVIAGYFLVFWNRLYLFLRLKSTQNRDKNVPQPLKIK